MQIRKLVGVVALGLIAYTPCAMAQSSAEMTPSNGPQVAQPEQGGVNWKGVGVGAGTVASNILYMPAKLAYGILGGIGGGAAYALTGGNQQVANTIWRSSLGGDYVVTPGMLTGKQQLHFNGPTVMAPANGAEAASPTTASEAMPPSSYAAASNPPRNSVTTHAIDSGAGPVGPSSASKAPASNLKTSPPPDTSIE